MCNYFVDLIITVHVIKSKASWSSDLQFERLHDIVKIKVTVQHIKSVGFQVTNVYSSAEALNTLKVFY